ncbi:MAG: YihY/virulence factor BrkB family protein [Cyclobacteriaceae bacterium]
MQFEKLIKNQHLNHNSLLNTLAGFITLALASTAGFSQLQRSLNAIWQIRTKPKSNILNYIVKRLTFFLALITLGFVLILSTMLGKLVVSFSENLPEFLANARLYESLLSFLLITLMLVALFRFLGSAKVPWKNALVSAGFTSILFLLGKEAINMYIAHSNLSSTFGAASIIALLMIWVFYTAQILYLGACFALIFGKKYGCRITPDEKSVRIVQKEIG